MRWFALVLLLSVGCQDTTLNLCDQADMPGPPTPRAYRAVTGDTLTWTWVHDDFQIVEMWKWDGCHWSFDRYIKTRVDV